MSIKTRWMNPEHTILLISYRGQIQEWEFIAVMNQIHQAIAGKNQPIHIVHDYSASNVNELLNGTNIPTQQSGSGALTL